MIYETMVHLLSNNFLLLITLSFIFLYISAKSIFKFEQNKISFKSKEYLSSKKQDHTWEIIVCYIPIVLSTAFILRFGTYSDFIMLFLGNSNFFALILLSDTKIKKQLTNKRILLNMMKLEIFVVLILFISIEVMYEAKEINLYILPISNGLALIMRLTIDLFENISLFIQFTALISASLIVVNCALLYITLPLLKELTEEN
jgi:membrane protein